MIQRLWRNRATILKSYAAIYVLIGTFILGITVGAIWFAFIMLTALFATGKM